MAEVNARPRRDREAEEIIISDDTTPSEYVKEDITRHIEESGVRQRRVVAEESGSSDVTTETYPGIETGDILLNVLSERGEETGPSSSRRRYVESGEEDYHGGTRERGRFHTITNLRKSYREGKKLSLNAKLVIGGIILGSLFLLWYLASPPRTAYIDGARVHLPPGSKLGSLWLPFLGETLDFIRAPVNFTVDRVMNYGPVVYSDVFFKDTVILSGPKALANFFNPELVSREASVPKSLSALLGETPLIQKEGPQHSLRRSIISYALSTPRYINAYVEGIDVITSQHIGRWLEKRNFEWMQEFKRLTADIASFLFFAEENRGQLYIEDWENVMNAINSIPLNLPFGTYERGLSSRNNLISWINHEIDAHLDSNLEVFDVLKVIMDNITQSNADISRQELMEDVFHMMMILNGLYKPLTEMVMALTQHQGIWSQARNQVMAVTPNGPITLDKLNMMPFIGHIVNEVLRFYPVVPMLFGHVKKGFFTDGFYIPTGWRVIGSLYTTNNDPNQYPRPHLFDPTRYDKGEPLSGNLFTHGGGKYDSDSHRCLGEDLSYNIMRTVLVHILRDWRIWTAPRQSLDLDTSIFFPEPIDGFRVTGFTSRARG